MKRDAIQPNRTEKLARNIGIVFFVLLPLLVVGVSAGDGYSLHKKLYVGTIKAPPFAMKTADDRWEGFSIDLWQAVAQELRIKYELKEYDNIEQLITDTEKGNFDVIVLASQTKEHETFIDFSNAYYGSGSGIAVPMEGDGTGWLVFAKSFFSLRLLSLICLLILLWFIAGVCVFFFESQRNSEMFGGGWVKGLGHGIWWAAVTMTTVGYGDKVPKTLRGRIVAIIWMFSSIIIISSFVATITTHLTVGKLYGKVHGIQDLPNVRVGTVAESESLNFLKNRGIVAQEFQSARQGVQAIADNLIDAFVYDEVVLYHLIKNDFNTIVRVLPGSFDDYYIGMGFPTGSSIREPINRALLKIMDTEEFVVLKNRYFGTRG